MTATNSIPGRFQPARSTLPALRGLSVRRTLRSSPAAPKLVKTAKDDPISIAMLEVEAGAIELVDLSETELAALAAESKMATEEAEILEALRSRVTEKIPAGASAAGKPGAVTKAKVKAGAKAAAGSDDKGDEKGDEKGDDKNDDKNDDEKAATKAAGGKDADG